MMRIRGRIRARHQRRAAGDRRFARRDRGAAIVEFAMVVPILAALTMGIFETGFLWKEAENVDRMVAQAGRVASTNTPFSSAFADYEALRAIDAGSGSLKNSTIVKVIIYDSPTADGQVPSECTDLATGGVAGVCNVYNATQVATSSPSGFPRGAITNPMCPAPSWDASWCFRNRNREPGSNIDFLGVYIEVLYDSYTNLFPATITIKKDAIFQLEPCIETGGTNQCF